MPSLNHLHSWIRSGLNTKTFLCDHPDCTTSMTRDRLVGKRALCACCHQMEFILHYDDLKRKMPKCYKCARTKEAKAKQAAEAVLATVLPSKEEGLL